MIVLGIETSCDETAVGIVDADGTVLANVLYSQLEDHRAYGGVVPEIAARAHVSHLDGLIRQALTRVNLTVSKIDAFAATCGPGLIGGVMVGMMAGKALAAATGKPFIAVNHLEAHILTPRLTHDVPFPYLVLLISGGHTQILLARGLGDYKILGDSLDDAAGEAFDKSAKLMGLPYPGGPQIEALAKQCLTPAVATVRYPLPRPMVGRPGCDFSFSGLKTAVRETVHNARMDPSIRADLCYALQQAIADILCDRLEHAISLAKESHPDLKHLVLAGGVAANNFLRTKIQNLGAQHQLTLVAPPISLCTDNGVMIAWAGLERLQQGKTDPLDVPARPRWPLNSLEERL